MRKAGLVVWDAHEAMKAAIRPGMTTAELDAIVENLFAQRGAVPLFKGVQGKIPFPAVTCISVNDAVVHGIPNDRVLVEGDIVSVDTGCKLDGWCADSAWTLAVGKISPLRQKLLDVTEGSLAMAIKLIPTKKRWGEVAAEMAKYVRAAGFSVVEDFVGHGIGRELHEEPKVPNYANAETRQTDFELRPGLVIAVEPMVNIGVQSVKVLPDHWTQVTTDGKDSAHFEHTLAVTKNGVRILTGPPVEGEDL
jgi:methionyl aminopeptidase